MHEIYIELIINYSGPKNKKEISTQKSSPVLSAHASSYA